MSWIGNRDRRRAIMTGRAMRLTFLTFLPIIVSVMVGVASATSVTGQKPHPLSLDVNRPALGNIRLGENAAFYQRIFGLPSDVQTLPTGPIMSWYSRAGLRAAVAFSGNTEQNAISIYYAGAIRTAHGDGIGTRLATFLNHWPGAEKAGTWWSRSYRVAAVWFHFNAKNRLFAIELGQRSVTLAHAPRK